ncbi:MAG: hypothetical protein FJY20_00855 [Bacteroidetes bacterium]|nr:hypothetical protein [Bacteroidota bacterium]
MLKIKLSPPKGITSQKSNHIIVIRRLVFITLCIVHIAYGQSKIATDSISLRIKSQATDMANALAEKKYPEFTKYMHPKTIKDGGMGRKL